MTVLKNVFGDLSEYYQIQLVGTRMSISNLENFEDT